MSGPSDIPVEVFGTLSNEECELICAPLRDHNLQFNATFFQARELPHNASKDLSVVARDAGGKLLGGLLGETQFAWLKISVLTVRSDARRRGIGAALMRAAETEAIRRGCRYAFVDTLDYQAPAFYEKLGYRIVGRIPDWDSHGHEKIYLTRTIG
jgi:ribosomal protein S18 acetylase RimI-like enzyme